MSFDKHLLPTLLSYQQRDLLAESGIELQEGRDFILFFFTFVGGEVLAFEPRASLLEPCLQPFLLYVFFR
jgi:hypothetical protein